MTELIARLRESVVWLKRDGFLMSAKLNDEAADELERLTPTEDEKKLAREQLQDSNLLKATRPLLRKYVLREKP